MRKYLNQKVTKLIIFLTVLIFTFILRAHNYNRSPTMGNLEEMLYAWSGIYLVETGTPVSWSTLDYPKRAKVFSGTIDYKGGKPTAGVTLYKPWLDEPPLFSYIVGWFGHIYKADRTDWIPTSYIRMPVILFGTITSILIFLVARTISSYWMGILSMIVYGTVPILVLGSRLAVPENLIAMCFILMIYLLILFERSLKFHFLLPLPLIVGIAGLSKPTGFFLLPLAIFIAFRNKFFKGSLYLVLASLPFVAFFFIYGIYYDAEIFWKITSIQSLRPVGFNSLGWFFTSPAYDWRIFTDSWYIFCLLAAAYFILNQQALRLGQKKERGKNLLMFSFVYWVLVIMISGGEGDLLAWYRFPLFPFLSIIGAWGLILLVSKANFFTSFIAAGLLLGGRHLLVNAFRPNIAPTTYRLVLSGLLLPSLINIIYDRFFLKFLSRMIIMAIIIVGIYFNVKFIYNEYELACEGAECILGPSTFLSSLYFPIIWRFFVL